MGKSIITRGMAILGCASAISVASAAGDNMLVHVNGSTTPLQVEVSGQTKITFDNTAMKISQSSGETTLDIADIDRMVFDLQTSSTEEIDAPLSDDITFTVSGKYITVTSASGSEVAMSIFDTAGRQVAALAGAGTVEYDFSDKKAGVYIIVCGDKTIKYLNR